MNSYQTMHGGIVGLTFGSSLTKAPNAASNSAKPSAADEHLKHESMARRGLVGAVGGILTQSGKAVKVYAYPWP